MPTFNYEALDARGRMVTGWIEAQSAEAVIEELRSVHYTVTNVKEKRDYIAALSDYVMKMQGVSLYALAIFTRQFSTIYNAGIPVARGLDGLARQTLNKKLQQMVHQIHNDIIGGFSLTRALQRHPEVFDPVYIALVRAGEMAGALGAILERLANLLERENSLRKKVQSSMTYPTFVFVFACLITGLLVNYIFPQFVSLLEGLDLQLPWPTMFLIHITNAIKNPVVFTLMVTLFVLSVFLLKQYISTPIGRRNLDKLKIELPIVGNINRKVAIARFCRTLGTLLESGLPVVSALEIVGEVSGNVLIKQIIDEITMSLKAGSSLSVPMKTYKIFPPMVSNMVSVGEESGNLPLMLDKLSDFYDDEVEVALDQFIAMLEPVMVFVMGGVVAFVLIAVFLPIYGILQNF